MKQINVNGVHALRTEGYLLPIQAELTLQDTERAWWAHPAFILFLTVALSVLDAMVLYDIMDSAMTQSAWLGKLVAFGIALVLNVIPLMIAKLTHQAIYNLKRFAGVWALTGVLAFLLLFTGTVWLRFAYRDAYEAGSGVTQLETTVETGAAFSAAAEENEEDAHAKGTAVVVLLSVEPLVTSVANFLLAYFSEDELRARINRLRLRRLELLEAKSDLQAALANMDGDRQQLLQLDEARYRAAREVITARCEYLRAEARRLLAEYLADPTATTKLSAEAVETDPVSPPARLHALSESA